MHSPISASIASSIASLLNFGGTNATDTSAPVAAIASATEPNTGRSRPSCATDCPALRALTPPTTLVPARSIRAVCFDPSEPVIPCTMTLLSSLSQTAISHPRRSQLSGAPRRLIHRLDLLDHRDPRLVQDPPALLGVVTVQPHHD